MEHGVAGYFLERSRFERRVSLLTLAVSLLFSACLLLATIPPVQRTMERTAMRFGYEGRTQYVRRITLRQYQGSGQILTQVGRVNPATSRRGGDKAPKRTDPRSARVEFRPRLSGPGSAARDLVERSTFRAAGVPLVQSEDLVIEHLIVPEYPPHLLENDIEGKVLLQALIDTEGRVIDVQVMASTGEPLFEHAAVEAARQSRFRPYRPAGVPIEVYVLMPYDFGIN
ncbi:MAG TPA: energy transducer TonB [Candidatus Eisenbacteria bacterium]|jgi:TonB family protein